MSACLRRLLKSLGVITPPRGALELRSDRQAGTRVQNVRAGRIPIDHRFATVLATGRAAAVLRTVRVGVGHCPQLTAGRIPTEALPASPLYITSVVTNVRRDASSSYSAAMLR